MPIVIAKQVTREFIGYSFSSLLNGNRFVVEANVLGKTYDYIILQGTRCNAYLSRVFNEAYEPCTEPRIFSCLNLLKTEKNFQNKLVSMYYLDIDELAHQLSIPDGYFVEILLTSIINREFGEKVLFPNETKKYVATGLEKLTDEKMNMLSGIGAISQSHSFLAELGLGDIAKELSLGYSRFDIGDTDGAIKSYRKVVEGFRNYLEEKETKEEKKVFKRLIDNSENRTEKVVDFLNKTYSLISNFGEHYGTVAFEEEGVFSHKLVENLTEYLTKKLRKK
jgi:hypothetical protein